MNSCIAHRGWSSRAPENTIAAFILALNESKISAIELDVHLSKDGVPVVIHDHTLERTTNGKGTVSTQSALDLVQLDAGISFGPQFVGQKIPLLEEVMALAKGKKRLLIELKQMGELYVGLEEKVAELINKYNMYHQVVVISFDHESVRKVKEYDPIVEIGLVFTGQLTMLADQVDYTGASYLSIQHRFITKELVELFQDKCVQLVAWTIDDVGSLNRMKGISGNIHITTNRPEIMIEDVKKAKSEFIGLEHRPVVSTEKTNELRVFKNKK